MAHLLMLRVTVKDGERALLTRNGRFEQVLGPGRHRLFDPANELAVELTAVVRAEFSADRYAVLKAAQPRARGAAVRGGRDRCRRGRHRQPRRPAGASARAMAGARVLEGRDPRRCRAHQRGERPEGRRAASLDGRAGAQPVRRRDRGREPRGGSPLRRGPAHRAARAGPARLLDGRAQGRGEAPRSPAAGGRDHGAGDADQGPHRAARDAHLVPPDRRSGARGEHGRGRGRLALPPRPVRDPRGGRLAHARRGALGQERPRRGAARLRA